MDKEKLHKFILSAQSSDLDEFLIDSLKAQGSTITSWGVGTHLITSKDCPSFGGVYKLAAIMKEDGTFIPKIKLSENSEKVTNPGNKTIYRIYDKETGKCKLLVATGCLVQRYEEALKSDMPEIDLLMGVSQYEQLPRAIEEAI